MPRAGCAGSAGRRCSPPLTLEIRDYVAFPITGRLDGTGQTDGMLARINSLREEPGGANRFFVNDLNGPLYILDKATKKLTTYLDFNGRDGRPGLFHKLAYEVGFANGLVSLQFDPDYRRNGKFYTVHIEDPALDGSNLPDNANVAGLNIAGYTATAPIATPGPIQREGVLIEWTDTNIVERDLRRHGARAAARAAQHAHPSARRSELQSRPRGRGDARLARAVHRLRRRRIGRVVASGHRATIRSGSTRWSARFSASSPISSEHTSTSIVSENGRYRIPNDNPFVAIAGARKEIWAYGLRNPHRLHWAIDPANPRNNRLIANSIGLRTWETVNIIHKGANYGYSLREGNEALRLDNKTTARPEVDRDSRADQRHA